MFRLPVLIEVQALAVEVAGRSGNITAQGVDGRRAALLAAVLATLYRLVLLPASDGFPALVLWLAPAVLLLAAALIVIMLLRSRRGSAPGPVINAEEQRQLDRILAETEPDS